MEISITRACEMKTLEPERDDLLYGTLGSAVTSAANSGDGDNRSPLPGFGEEARLATAETLGPPSGEAEFRRSPQEVSNSIAYGRFNY